MSTHRPPAVAAAWSVIATALIFSVPSTAKGQGVFGDAIFGPQPTVTDDEESRQSEGIDLGEPVPFDEWLQRKADEPGSSGASDPAVAPGDSTESQPLKPVPTPTVPSPLDLPDENAPAVPSPTDLSEPPAVTGPGDTARPQDVVSPLNDLDAYPLLPEDDDLLLPRPAEPTPSLRRPAESPSRNRNGFSDWGFDGSNALPNDEQSEDAWPNVELLPAPAERETDKPAFDDVPADVSEPRDSLTTPLLVQPRGNRDYNPAPVLPRLPTPEETGPAAPFVRETPVLPRNQRTFRPRAAEAGTPEGVRLAIGSELLNTLFRNEQQRCGAVNDFILGAQVRGSQQTRTRTSLRLRPCEESARFEVVLEGRTLNETTGSTSIAAVRSMGDHRFELIKPFNFDGDTVQTATPAATVWPQQTNIAAVPLRGRVPGVARLVGRLAYEEAERRKPAAERIAADRLSRRVAEQFNSSVDPVLTRLQEVWDGQLLATLERTLPDAKRPTARTTETHAVFKLPTPNALEAEANLPADWPVNAEGVSLAVHESAVVAALDRLSLGGREVPRGDWDGLINQLLPHARVANRPATDETSIGSLRLADVDPVAIQFEGGQANVILRAVIVTPIGESRIQRIVIPWTVSVDTQGVYLNPGKPEVTPDDPTGRSDIDPTLMDRVREVVEMKVSEEMRPVRLRRSIDFPVSDRTMNLTLADMRMRNGWLVLSWAADLR